MNSSAIDPSAPYSAFMTDDTLRRLARAATNLGLKDPQKHFSRILPNEADFVLTSRSGYQKHQLDRALCQLRGEAIEPKACVAERLKIALCILGDLRADDLVRKSPGLVPLAQRQLTELLLEYPVLMHPRVQIHVFADGETGICSVAHAIALSARGRFPMIGDAGADSESLKTWMRQPSVRLGFSTAAIKLNGLTSEAAAGLDPFEAAAWRLRPIPLVIVSAHQLFSLAGVDPKEHDHFSRHVAPLNHDERWSGHGVEAYTRSFFASCGVLDGWTCAPFFDAIRARRFGENPSLIEWVSQSIGVNLLDQIEQTHGILGARFQAISNGLIACGFVADPVGAAQFIWDGIALPSTPTVDVSQALEVMRLATGHGARISLDGIDFGSELRNSPWRTALPIHDAERAMKSVLGQVANEVPAPVAMPRRRMGV